MQEKKRKFTENHAVLTALAVMLVLSVALVFVNVGGTMGVSDTASAATVIKKGSSGADVKAVQTKLKNWGYYTGVVDGVFGSQTEAAVKYFQRSNKLTADGVVGAKTAAAMGITLSGSSSSGSSSGTGTGGYSAADVNLLARCIHGEARGEPYLGQVAVAAVVLNRVRSSLFPNSISGVIYQQYAFSSVLDGQINLAPGESALKAAKDAMNGWDPTNGCLYFYNAAKTSNAWIMSRTVKLEIGSHKFCV
ncbi:MAG: spore cortex-lytic enzyme [Clostridiaceae bacterium]|jgi:N-acetylmuramoyl-L-alanine amidase|nr:spore cortex-lytic enzyme [Clostridiaceae bacterium]